MKNFTLFQIIVTALIFAAVCAGLMAVVPAARVAFGVVALVLAAVFTGCVSKILVFSNK